MSNDDQPDLIALTQELLVAIENKDLQKYRTLVDESITCFEPEACGYPVEGIGFHEYYFKLGSGSTKNSSSNTTIVRPHQRMLGADAAVVSYIRLTQKIDPESGGPETYHAEETRVWHRSTKDGAWKNVHFHRSIPE
jgi:calcium/calmodulin-dependent protein kinase (CaM kinase) II